MRRLSEALKRAIHGKARYLVVLFSAALVLTASCAAPEGSYQSSDVSEEIIQSQNTSLSLAYHGPERAPVIVIHGLLGARLTEMSSGREIWGTFSRKGSSDLELSLLAHPMKKGLSLAELKNNTGPSEMLLNFDVRLGAIIVPMPSYSLLAETLEEAGYTSEAEAKKTGRYQDLFLFCYDWRRDISENAVELGKFINEKRAYLKKEYERAYGIKNADLKFDLVTHSMGGLLGRYYVMFGGNALPADTSKIPPVTWEGAKNVKKLIQIGTPNAGYLDTLIEMTKGLKLAPGAPVIQASLPGTWPSYYEMMPFPCLKSVYTVKKDGTKEYLDIYDVEVWKKNSWGLASKDADEEIAVLIPGVKSPEERHAIALDHLTKCLAKARQFSSAMMQQDNKNQPVETILFAGNTIETSFEAKVPEEGGLPEVAATDSGDGKISIISAHFDVRDRDAKNWSPKMVSPINWEAIYHTGGAHMGIMETSDFPANLRFDLVQKP